MLSMREVLPVGGNVRGEMTELDWLNGEVFVGYPSRYSCWCGDDRCPFLLWVEKRPCVRFVGCPHEYRGGGQPTAG
jgi:hypothetical protein